MIKQKTITVVTRDNIRTLHPHAEKSKQYKKSSAVVLNASELDSIQKASVYFSNQDLIQQSSDINNQKNDFAQKASERRLKMEQHDQKRAANTKLSELEKEAKEKSNYLLAKAQLQLEEQEDEIKHMNELMLYAKCVSIRDIQVAEKELIKKERKEEEARLDAMMEFDRVNALKRVEEREKERVEELRKGAAIIREQISQRREAALLDQERRDQETKLILKAIADNIEHEKAEKLKKINNQKELMKQVSRANAESIEQKRIAKLLDLEEDRKVMQYITDKEAREKQNDRLNQQKKIEREMELARLRTAQEKMTDKQAHQDALRAQRAFEAYERDWRRKEKEAAEKQAANEHELREERIKQQKAREYGIAVEAHKMRKEFYENLQRQKIFEEKLAKEKMEISKRNKDYVKEVKAQISEKEELRRKDRQEFFMEGVRLAQQRIDQRTKLDQIKERKIHELEALGVPQKYVKEIDRQVHLNKQTFSK